VDDLDFSILHAIGAIRSGPAGCPREALTASAIARAVRADPATVQSHLRHMQETGFLQGFQLFPNLSLFDLAERVHFYDDMSRDAKTGAFERLALVDGLIEAHDFWGGTLCVVLTYRSPSDLARKTALLREFLGREGRPIFERARVRARVVPDRLDWRIFQSLRHDALKPIPVVAKELGVSVRTVRRRLAKLSEARTYYLVPILDPRHSDGFVTAGFLLKAREADRPRVLARARQAIQDRALYEENADNGAYYVIGGFRNPDEANRGAKLLAGTEGVLSVEPYILQGMQSFSGWIDEAIEARVRNTPV
jgi:DNA-binding Lrp family transcriptional regulator